MRERTVPSNPLLVTPGHVTDACAVGAVSAVSAVSVPLAEEVRPAPEAADTLDKYDISLIACTD
jgi:hypothetical protein